MSIIILTEEQLAEINEVYPEHTYHSCNNDDVKTPNAGFNRCPRCTTLKLAKTDKLASVVSELKNVRNVSVHGDFSVKMEFASARSAEAFSFGMKELL